ncbi:CPXV055 protein [Cowpox virus]|uniref:CPXV055 protein n=1 Tax=Cowpox virus TaxID=10243 RepID=U5THQ9_COWPX|nr:CPXV055 protein [Cowpox virus]
MEGSKRKHESRRPQQEQEQPSTYTAIL